MPAFPVTPLAGVWVEIVSIFSISTHTWSLPSRECGLKSTPDKSNFNGIVVTPLAGVWVEIGDRFLTDKAVESSLPSRECGLKSVALNNPREINPVTPLAGVWVEMFVYDSTISMASAVTPLAGVWVEIFTL